MKRSTNDRSRMRPLLRAAVGVAALVVTTAAHPVAAQAIGFPATVHYDHMLVTMTPLPTPVDLSPAVWLGYATDFVTADPVYSCATKPIAVSAWSVPGIDVPVFQLPADTACDPGMWVFDHAVPLMNRVNRAADEAGGDDHGAPRIDIYLTDSYGTVPCTREVLSNNSKKYVCRVFDYTTTTIPKVCSCKINTEFVYAGEESGGDNYAVSVDEGSTTRVYEGCVTASSGDWKCAAVDTAIDNSTYLTKGKWYRNAFSKWATQAGTTVVCLGAIFNQDAQNISENCFAAPPS